MSKKTVLVLPVLLLCGCVVRSGSLDVSKDAAPPLRIRATEDLPAPTLAALQEVLRERAARAKGQYVPLDSTTHWISLIYLHGRHIGFVLYPDVKQISPEGREKRALQGRYLAVEHRGTGPFGLLYLRRSDAEFDTEGRNRRYAQVRMCLWGALWFDVQRGTPASDGGLDTHRAVGPLWSAFGYRRKGTRRAARVLFIPLPLGSAK